MTGKSDQITSLMNDPHLQAAFESVKSKLFKAFEACDSNDKDTLSDIHKRLNLLDAVKQSLEDAIQDGHYEDIRANEQETPPFLGDIELWRQKRGM
jgi:hypothetical protein